MGSPQLTPEQEQAQQIVARERERADESRSLPTLCTLALPSQPQQQGSGQMASAGERQSDSSLVAPRAAGDQQETPGGYRRPSEANIDSATGQPYLVYEVRFSTRF